MAAIRALVVDTNVAVAANGVPSQVSIACEEACRERLLQITRGRARLVLDDTGEIFDEYRTYLSFSGQPGVGVMFLKWVHDHQFNLERCERVGLTPHAVRGFTDFPDDSDLAGFDRSDRKFVAAARASASEPRVLNATDSDWWDYGLVLEHHGVVVDFVCEDQVGAWRRARPRRS